MLTPEAQERIEAIQEELFQMVNAHGLTEKEARAMRKAYAWLTDITQPLCDAENDSWLSMADEFCESAVSHYHSTDYEFDLNDYDRRCELAEAACSQSE